MKRFSNVMMTVALTSVLLFGCSSNSTSPSEPSKWWVYEGVFQTNSLHRAQEEIPFDIVIPAYIPYSNETNIQLNIIGPLNEGRVSDRITLEILYAIDLENDITGWIWIEEFNHKMLPPDTELNPRYENISISGRDVVITEGNFPRGPGTVFHFNRDGIYFYVEISNFTREEAIKVVESMLQ